MDVVLMLAEVVHQVCIWIPGVRINYDDSFRKVRSLSQDIVSGKDVYANLQLI